MLLFVCLFLSFELVTGDGEHYLPAMNQCANWFSVSFMGSPRARVLVVLL